MKTARLMWLALGIATCAPGFASAQPLITFDDWSDGCDMTSPCSNGYFDGDVGSFSVITDFDGEMCLSGKCVLTTWDPAAADTQFPQIRPLDSGAPRTTQWVQADFYLPGELITLLESASDVQVTLLQINTDTGDHYARLYLERSSSGWLHTLLSLDTTVSASTPDYPVTEGWHSVAFGLEIPAPMTGGPATMTLVFDGMEATGSSSDWTNPGVNIVSAWGLGPGTSDGAAPRLVIENLCFAESEALAAAACATATPPDAGPGDAGPGDAGPGDAAITDAATDGSTPDGSRDTGAPAMDGGAGFFRGAGGCDCRVVALTPRAFGAPLFLAIAAGLAWRRRRR